MKKKKITILVVILVLFSLTLQGCGASGGSNPTSSPTNEPAVTNNTSGETVATDNSNTVSEESAAVSSEPWDTTKKDTITLSVMNNYYTAGWKLVAQNYMDLHPETTVVVDVVADNDAYFTKCATWKAATDLSNASDIIHINFYGATDAEYTGGRVYDFNDMLSELNPYNGNQTVSACLDPQALSTMATGTYLGALPFDWCGIAIFYNKDLLDKYGLEAPKTFEEFQSECATLRQNGMQYPISSDTTATWYLNGISDAALRGQESQILVQPGDYNWDPSIMAVNENFAFNENDWSCDRFTVVSQERRCMYLKQTQFADPITAESWNQFAKIGQYFQQGFMEASGDTVLTSFEQQNAAFLISGSWNVGVINADMKQLGNSGFQWATMQFPPFANPPAGFQSGIRTLFTLGNVMGILITHGTGDHLERVKDFYKYCYCPSGAQTMYQATLDAGNYVQGPPAITGVTLPADLTAMLDGFVTTGTVKTDFGVMVGQDYTLGSDRGNYIDNINKLMDSKQTAAEFCANMQPYWMAKLDQDISDNGFDLNPANTPTPPQQ